MPLCRYMLRNVVAVTTRHMRPCSCYIRSPCKSTLLCLRRVIHSIQDAVLDAVKVLHLAKAAKKDFLASQVCYESIAPQMAFAYAPLLPSMPTYRRNECPAAIGQEGAVARTALHWKSASESSKPKFRWVDISDGESVPYDSLHLVVAFGEEAAFPGLWSAWGEEHNGIPQIGMDYRSFCVPDGHGVTVHVTVASSVRF